MIDMSIYLVTDDRMLWDACQTAVQQAVNGGVTVVQLRDKISPRAELKRRAMDLLSVLSASKIPLIINDDVELACEIGASGVHIGKNDISVQDARRILGPGAIIGLSLDSPAQFDPSLCRHCDYVSASPVFATTTKLDAAPPWGITALAQLRHQTDFPIVAIGGLNDKNIAQVAGLGIDGAAFVSAILSAADPKRAAMSLKSIFAAHKRGERTAAHVF